MLRFSNRYILNIGLQVGVLRKQSLKVLFTCVNIQMQLQHVHRCKVKEAILSSCVI